MRTSIIDTRWIIQAGEREKREDFHHRYEMDKKKQQREREKRERVLGKEREKYGKRGKERNLFSRRCGTRASVNKHD